MAAPNERDIAINRAFARVFGVAEPEQVTPREPTAEEQLADRQLANLFGVSVDALGPRRPGPPPPPPPPPPPAQPAPAAPPPASSDSFAAMREDLAVLQAQIEALAKRRGIDLTAKPRSESEARVDDRQQLVDRALKKAEEDRAFRRRLKAGRKLDRLIGR
jgi:hypothetical protein